MPAGYSLSVYRGDSYSWQFALWNDVDKTQPYDLTGFTAKAEIRDKPSGMIIVPLTLTVTLPNIIGAVLDAPSSSLLPIPGVWDLQLTDATGWVTTVIAGKVYVTPDVTDSSPPVAVPARRSWAA